MEDTLVVEMQKKDMKIQELQVTLQAEYFYLTSARKKLNNCKTRLIKYSTIRGNKF